MNPAVNLAVHVTAKAIDKLVNPPRVSDPDELRRAVASRTALVTGAVHGMRARLDQLTTRLGQPVSRIGWSLGGIYARQLARRTVHVVRQVITLGSPIRLARQERSQQ